MNCQLIGYLEDINSRKKHIKNNIVRKRWYWLCEDDCQYDGYCDKYSYDKNCKIHKKYKKSFKYKNYKSTTLTLLLALNRGIYLDNNIKYNIIKYHNLSNCNNKIPDYLELSIHSIENKTYYDYTYSYKNKKINLLIKPKSIMA